MTVRIEMKVVAEETFTFTPEGEDEEVHIFSGKLRRWLHDNVKDKVINLHFPTDQTEEELIAQHGLEAPRMASMTEAEAKEPVIVGLWPGGAHVLIDGAHRRWFWHKRGVNTLKGWVVPHEVWKHFTVDMTDAMLLKHHKDGTLLPHRRQR